MKRVEQEHTYWDAAAQDPDVAVKYIADIDMKDCLQALLAGLLSFLVMSVKTLIHTLTMTIMIDRLMLFGCAHNVIRIDTKCLRRLGYENTSSLSIT